MQVPNVYLKDPYTDTLMIFSSAKEPDKRARQKSPTKELYENKLVIVCFAQDHNNRALQRSPTKCAMGIVSFLQEPVKKLYKRA